MEMPTDREIAAFFADKAANAGFIDRLKIRYRPYICPFRTLLGFTAGESSLFDIGCGSGQFCLLAAQFSGVERIHGIEIDQRLVGNACDALSEMTGVSADVTFAVFDGQNLPAEVYDYGLVFMVDVLHHVPPPLQREFLERVHAAMRPGASLLLKDIDAASPLVAFNRIHDIVFAGSAGREWSHADARRVCAETGFNVAESFTQRVGLYPHYFLRLVKT